MVLRGTVEGASSPIGLVVVLVALITGCGNEREASVLGWAGSVDTVAGTPVVRNPATPLFDESDVVLTVAWSARNDADTDGGVLLEGPRDIELGAGAVAVLDNQARRLHAFDADDGGHLWTAGRAGEGPGELAVPTSLAFHRGEFWVLDTGKKAAERFGPEGTHTGAERIDAVLFSLQSLGDEGLLVGLFGPQGATPQQVREPDGDFRNLELPVPPGVPESVLSFEGDCRSGVAWTGGRLVHSLCSVPFVQLLDLEGGRDRAISIDGGLRVRGEEEIDAQLAETRESMAGMPEALVDEAVRRIREQIEYRRPFRRPTLDLAAGYLMLWEQEGQDSSIRPATLHFLTPDGIYVARVPLEESWIDYVADGRRLFALVEDPGTGLASVRAYEITFSERLARALRADATPTGDRDDRGER